MTIKILTRFAAFGSAFYGLWIWSFHSFERSSAFSMYGGVPEPVFALPLLAAAGLIVLGERHGWRWASFLGPLLSFTIFLAAEISCWMATLKSTGVPAYLHLCLFYGALTVCAGLKPTASAVRT